MPHDSSFYTCPFLSIQVLFLKSGERKKARLLVTPLKQDLKQIGVVLGEQLRPGCLFPAGDALAGIGFSSQLVN